MQKSQPVTICFPGDPESSFLSKIRLGMGSGQVWGGPRVLIRREQVPALRRQAQGTVSDGNHTPWSLFPPLASGGHAHTDRWLWAPWLDNHMDLL